MCCVNEPRREYWYSCAVFIYLKTKTMKWTIKRLSDVAVEVRCKYDANSNKFRFLLSADWHWDNPKCQRALLKNHLDEAVATDAGVFCFGDLFCAMQGKYDKRSSKSDLRQEHQTSHYLDSLVNTARDWIEPYKSNMIAISEGNHETSIKRRHETDLIARLCENLDVDAMPYKGWVIFVFEHNAGGGIRRKVLKYYHGYGGGGPVTKGVIQTNRRATYLPDADFIVTGHVHESWIVELVRERINTYGKPKLEPQYHIQVPTYKEEYLVGKGWHTETGKPPKPLGAYWLEFELFNKEVRSRVYRT